MLKTWAEDLIKQCQVAKIPIFFKQWGDFNEDGIKKEFSERKTEVNPKINGNSYSFYPQEDGNDSLL